MKIDSMWEMGNQKGGDTKREQRARAKWGLKWEGESHLAVVNSERPLRSSRPSCSACPHKQIMCTFMQDAATAQNDSCILQLLPGRCSWFVHSFAHSGARPRTDAKARAHLNHSHVCSIIHTRTRTRNHKAIPTAHVHTITQIHTYKSISSHKSNSYENTHTYTQTPSFLPSPTQEIPKVLRPLTSSSDLFTASGWPASTTWCLHNSAYLRGRESKSQSETQGKTRSPCSVI